MRTGIRHFATRTKVSKLRQLWGIGKHIDERPRPTAKRMTPLLTIAGLKFRNATDASPYFIVCASVLRSKLIPAATASTAVPGCAAGPGSRVAC